MSTTEGENERRDNNFKIDMLILIVRWNKKRDFNDSSFGIAIGDQIRLENILKQTIMLVILLILSVIIYDNIDEINEIKIVFLKIGSLILLILAFFIVKYCYRIYINLKYLIKFRSDKTKFILIIFLLLLVVYFYFNQEEIVPKSIGLITGINYSNFNPIYLDLDVEDNYEAQEGGGSTTGIETIFSIEPERKSECMATFEYVNELRKENGKNEILWDDRLYELAIFRTKDMYERNYFDHVTPDGTCVKDFKSDYGLDEYTIAENAGAQMEGWNEYDMEYSKTINVKEQVDNWMDSRGHRYNLLYSDHKIGAIGCYYGVCVFLGGHTNPYGLGAGPCTTGEEGLEYWENVPIQPGEVN